VGAEEDAEFAINFALAAIEEAEYAALDATLAGQKADELSARSGASPEDLRDDADAAIVRCADLLARASVT
jgi:hypothetical protein